MVLFLRLFLLANKDLDDWEKTIGWCVDAEGSTHGRNPEQSGYTEEDCLGLCKADPNLNGCTWMRNNENTGCATYTGNIVGGNGQSGGLEEMVCYSRKGINQIMPSVCLLSVYFIIPYLYFKLSNFTVNFR